MGIAMRERPLVHDHVMAVFAEQLGPRTAAVKTGAHSSFDAGRDLS
jgi:hypothetical protein